MKKGLIAVLCISLLLAMSGCGSEKTVAEAPVPQDSVPLPEEELPVIADGEVIDLTVLSVNMVYGQVFSMMSEPGGYVGREVKMAGTFDVYHDEGTDKWYFACIIADALACCSQGIEFELEGEHSFPEDYPQVGDNICVDGVFDTYEEDGNVYCTLRNAKFCQ